MHAASLMGQPSPSHLLEGKKRKGPEEGDEPKKDVSQIVRENLQADESTFKKLRSDNVGEKEIDGSLNTPEEYSHHLLHIGTIATNIISTLHFKGSQRSLPLTEEDKHALALQSPLLSSIFSQYYLQGISEERFADAQHLLK